MWQIGSYISAMMSGLILSHCIFFTLQSVPSAAVFCCEREKRLKVCTFISKNLVQDYRKDHAKEK